MEEFYFLARQQMPGCVHLCSLPEELVFCIHEFCSIRDQVRLGRTCTCCSKTLNRWRTSREVGKRCNLHSKENARKLMQSDVCFRCPYLFDFNRDLSAVETTKTALSWVAYLCGEYADGSEGSVQVFKRLAPYTFDKFAPIILCHCGSLLMIQTLIQYGLKPELSWAEYAMFHGDTEALQLLFESYGLIVDESWTLLSFGPQRLVRTFVPTNVLRWWDQTFPNHSPHFKRVLLRFLCSSHEPRDYAEVCRQFECFRYDTVHREELTVSTLETCLACEQLWRADWILSRMARPLTEDEGKKLWTWVVSYQIVKTCASLAVIWCHQRKVPGKECLKCLVEGIKDADRKETVEWILENDSSRCCEPS